jgi:hypothetical protein
MTGLFHNLSTSSFIPTLSSGAIYCSSCCTKFKRIYEIKFSFRLPFLSVSPLLIPCIHTVCRRPRTWTFYILHRKYTYSTQLNCVVCCVDARVAVSMRQEAEDVFSLWPNCINCVTEAIWMKAAVTTWYRLLRLTSCCCYMKGHA